MTVAHNTFVTSANRDEKKDIYFNESFYHSTNRGSEMEAGFSDALVNTYGYNYQVNKVEIFVEDKLYEDQCRLIPDIYFKTTLTCFFNIIIN